MAASVDPKLKLNKVPLGASGTQIFGGIYTEEYLEQLQGCTGAAVFNKMRRSDPQVRKVLNAIMNPLKSGDWDIEPVSSEKKDLEVAALIKHILFDDLKWHKLLHEILTFLSHGYSLFEVVHMNREDKEFGKYTGLGQLAFRSQTTLIRFNHNMQTGELESVEQNAFGDIMSTAVMPADTLLMFINEQEGDDNGMSILRPLFGPYKRKLMAMELQFIGIERGAIPPPILKVPSNIKTDSEEYQDAVQVIKDYTSAENAFLTYPEGWELDFNSDKTFDPTKINDVINTQDEQMAGSIVATFLQLGISGNAGSLSLGDKLESFFTKGLEAIASVVKGPFNKQLIPQLVRLNYGDSVVKCPELVCPGITDEAGEELMRIVTGYSNAGVIQKDEGLEDHVRKLHKLPKKDEGSMMDNQEGEDDPNPTDPKEEEREEEVEEVVEPDKDEEVKNLNNKNYELSIKNPRRPDELIIAQSRMAADLIRDQLRSVSGKFISDIMRNYSKLPADKKLKAIDGVKVGGKTKFKKELRTHLIQSATKSLEMVKGEVPGAGRVDFKIDERVIKILDPDSVFKFNDFSKLPRHVQLLLERQAEAVANAEAEEVTDRVIFQFMSTEQSTDSEAILRQDLENAADQYIDGGNADRTARNVDALLINDTRNAFFFDDEVLGQIESFTFVNDSPVADICVTLSDDGAGRTFSKNDAEFLQHQPPLHHNCTSYIRANLASNKNNPEVQGLPTITEKDRKSITLNYYAEIMKFRV